VRVTGRVTYRFNNVKYIGVPRVRNDDGFAPKWSENVDVALQNSNNQVCKLNTNETETWKSQSTATRKTRNEVPTRCGYTTLRVSVDGRQRNNSVLYGQANILLHVHWRLAMAQRRPDKENTQTTIIKIL